MADRGGAVITSTPDHTISSSLQPNATVVSLGSAVLVDKPTTPITPTRPQAGLVFPRGQN